jgi:periplasmic protein TonB
MHIIGLRALMCASLALAPFAAHGRDARPQSGSPITVAAPDSLAHWTAQVSRDLDAHLVYPNMVGRDNPPEGAVRVGFQCSETGAPSHVTLLQSSRSRDLDQAALHAVQNISTLHPLPVDVTHDRAMEAWVFFASDQDRVGTMKRALERQVQVAAAERTGTQMASLPPLVIASR